MNCPHCKATLETLLYSEEIITSGVATLNEDNELDYEQQDSDFIGDGALFTCPKCNKNVTFHAGGILK